jgi:hypothetical protein
MGAKLCCVIHIAVVMGHDFKSQLKATTMSSPDIRAGIIINRRSFSKRNKYDPKH